MGQYLDILSNINKQEDSQPTKLSYLSLLDNPEYQNFGKDYGERYNEIDSSIQDIPAQDIPETTDVGEKYKLSISDFINDPQKAFTHLGEIVAPENVVKGLAKAGVAPIEIGQQAYKNLVGLENKFGQPFLKHILDTGKIPTQIEEYNKYQEKGWNTLIKSKFFERKYDIATDVLMHPGKTPTDTDLKTESEYNYYADLMANFGANVAGDVAEWATRPSQLLLTYAITKGMKGVLTGVEKFAPNLFKWATKQRRIFNTNTNIDPVVLKNLGLNKDASLYDVKLAHQRLSKIYHPDNKLTGDAEIFKKIQGTYDAIKHEYPVMDKINTGQRQLPAPKRNVLDVLRSQRGAVAKELLIPGNEVKLYSGETGVIKSVDKLGALVTIGSKDIVVPIENMAEIVQQDKERVRTPQEIENEIATKDKERKILQEIDNNVNLASSPEKIQALQEIILPKIKKTGGYHHNTEDGALFIAPSAKFPGKWQFTDMRPGHLKGTHFDDIIADNPQQLINKLPESYVDMILKMDVSPEVINKKLDTILHSNTEYMKNFDTTKTEILPEQILNIKNILDKSENTWTDSEKILLGNFYNHLRTIETYNDKILLDGKLQEVSDIVDESIKNILNSAKKAKIDINATVSSDVIDASIHAKKISSIRKLYTLDHWNIELKTDILGGEDHNILTRILYDGFDDAETNQLRFEQNIEDYLRDQWKDLKDIDITKWSEGLNKENFIVNKLRKSKMLPQKVDYQTVELAKGKKISLSKGQRMSMYLHSKNEQNMKHITEGGIRFENNIGRIHKLSKLDVALIVDSMTKEEKLIAESMRSVYNGIIKDELNYVSTELNGFRIATQNDYFHIRTLEMDRQRNITSEAERLKKSPFKRTLEGMGMLKSRTDATNALVLEDAFSALYSHIKNAGTYIGYASPLRNAKTLLSNVELQEAIINTYGEDWLNSVKQHIDSIEAYTSKPSTYEKITQDMINALDPAMLGMNPWVIIKQFPSYINALTEMDVKYLLNIKNLRLSKTDKAEIKKISPQLRARFEGKLNQEMGELVDSTNILRFFTGKDTIGNRATIGVTKADTETVGRIWKAVKLEISDKFPNLKQDEYMEKVRKRAEEVIRKTQPTFSPKDRSPIGNSKSKFTRLATKYTSQRNKNTMMAKRAYAHLQQSDKTTEDYAIFYKNIAIVLAGNAIMIAAIDEARDRLYKRKRTYTWGERARRIASAAIGNYYFIGDLVNSIISKYEMGTFFGYDQSNIVYSTLDTATDAVADTLKLAEQYLKRDSKEGRYQRRDKKAGIEKGDYKYTRTAVKVLDKVAEVSLHLNKIPYRTLKALVKGGMAWTPEKKKSTRFL